MISPRDYMISDEWRRVCGPYVKPPKMQQWKIAAAPDFDLADSGRFGLDMLKQIDECMKPRRVLMEQAVRMVFVLGYEPSDCHIEYVRGIDKIDEPSVEVDRLVVAGKPCFEVRVERSPITNFEITYTTTPRLIAWPSARQPRASSGDQA